MEHAELINENQIQKVKFPWRNESTNMPKKNTEGKRGNRNKWSKLVGRDKAKKFLFCKC
jgi:hypothetical protein